LRKLSADILPGHRAQVSGDPYCKISGMTDDRCAIGTAALPKGGHMKKIVLLLIVTAFAASPTAAATKQKKSKQATKAEQIAQQHDNTRRALRDSLPLVLPSWSLPIFFGMHMDEKLKENDKK
jgi:hypothetical protein